MLILLVMESPEYDDGDYYLATGDGFRNTTLESQASAIAQTMEDDFVRRDYDSAVVTCARNVADTIADVYGVTLSGGTGNNGNSYDYNTPEDEDGGGLLMGIFTLLVTIVLLVIIFSVLVSALVGLMSIRFMLRLVRNHKLYGFAIYVACMGVFVLVCQLFGVLFPPLFG